VCPPLVVNLSNSMHQFRSFGFCNGYFKNQVFDWFVPYRSNTGSLNKSRLACVSLD
jgi:hypothetical protein